MPRPSKKKPVRSPLSRQRVISAALELLDSEGTDGLTMRALGRKLGVDPMAVYYHIPNKAAVLDGIVEAVWSQLHLPHGADDTWQNQMRAIAHAIRNTLRQHPNALPIMAMRPNKSLAGLHVTDQTLGVLLNAGFAAQQALEFVNAAVEFLLGHAMVDGTLQTDDVDAELLAFAEQAHQHPSLPHLQRALSEADIRCISTDRIFEVGIETLLAGLQASQASASTPNE